MRKVICIVGLTCAIVVMIVIGTMFNQKTTILQPNMPIAYLEETAGAYVVAFGQGKGYIQKSQAQKTEPTVVVDLQLTAKGSGSIATKGERTTVYKTRSLESGHLMTLLPGLEYPIEGQWEDWYLLYEWGVRLGMCQLQKLL